MGLRLATVAAAAAALALAAASPATASADRRAAPPTGERPLPGFVGLTYREVATPHGCLEKVRVVRRVRKGDDADLAKLLTWPALGALAFDPADGARTRDSLRRFQDWFQGLVKHAARVERRQAAIAGDAARAPVVRVEAAARLAVAQQQLVMLFQGIEVPVHLRGEREMAEAFCDSLAEQATPLERKVRDAVDHCRKLIVQHAVPPGWWNDVCEVVSSPQPATP